MHGTSKLKHFNSNFYVVVVVVVVTIDVYIDRRFVELHVVMTKRFAFFGDE